MKKTLHIIPHSHWDREWYLPFEKHRTRLVDLFDNLIEVMEQNEDYTYYHMDGQYVVIEDYLEVRPTMRERLLALIRAGRIQIGPWYILQDEYLTSGEANVRNMLYGIRLCRAIGAEPVECGYFPDAFGNISQAPQIVRGFGFDNAVFGRGVNDVGADNEIIKQNGLTKSELIWRAPDGSEVLGVMFCNWYHNAMELPADPEALKGRLAHIVRSTSRFATTDHLLGMNGCDHQPLQKNLHEVIRLANDVQDEVYVKQSNFKDYIAAIRESAKDLKVFEGEINSQFTRGWGNLISTASAHVDIKQDNHRAQHLLAGIAEPLSTLLLANGGKYKSDLFLYAWKKLMQNHPHDSICACSCDEVYEEMKVRFMKAITCTEELRDYALDKLTAAVTTNTPNGDAAIVVYSLSPNRATTVVKACVDFERGTDLKHLALFDSQGNEIPHTVTYQPNTFTYTLPEDRFRQPRYVDRVTVEFPVTTCGIGYETYTLRFCKPKRTETLPYGFGSCENDSVRLTIRDNGSFDLYDKRSKTTYKDLHLFEDTADCGNLYNYVQPKGDTPILSTEKKARITLYEVNAYRVTYKVRFTLTRGVKLTSYLTLTNGTPRVDIKTVVENKKTDHRLRVLFPTNFTTESVYAEGQFDVVKRKIKPEFTWENPCNAQRMQAFVTLKDDASDSGLLFATRGLCEYEVLRDGKNTVALTLLRAVGEVGDWGVFPTPKGQKQGEYTLEYSVIPYQKDEESEAFSQGYAFAYPAAVAVGTTCHSGTLPASEQYVRFDNEYIRASAFKKKEDGNTTLLRLFNTHTEAIDLTITLADRYTAANLLTLGEELIKPLSVEDHTITLTVPAKKILTLELV
ncbi:MAG: alpha-mannosidase [Clostridia bacterium]|nr:alpha-mannosidase [Clostridia bacterium]